MNLTGNSKGVWTNKLVSYEDLYSIAAKYGTDNFLKPINVELKNLLYGLLKDEKRELILDMGCGIGESSFHLANEYPDKLIIALDKSISRLDRKNHFKKDLPKNIKFIHADILDFYPLLYSTVNEFQIKVYLQYFLYPNPWAKAKSVKKRFHASPIMPFVMALNSPVELRSNWKRYMEEFEYISNELYKRETHLTKLEFSNDWITPFEKKYALSLQDIYKLEVM